MEERLLSIGEIAQLCKISTKTLRHYDKIGLLKPEQINTENGYRLYSRKQIGQIHVIKKLQDTGCSLEELKAILQADKPHTAIIQLKQQITFQESRLKAEQEQLQKRMDTICLIQEELQRLQVHDEDTVQLFPERRLLCSEHTALCDASFPDGFLRLEQKISQEQNGSVSMFPALLISEKTNETTVSFCAQRMTADKADLMLPAGKYACFTIQGPYSNLAVQLKHCRQKLARRGLATEGFVFVLYYMNEAVTNSEVSYISEYQFKICA